MKRLISLLIIVMVCVIPIAKAKYLGYELGQTKNQIAGLDKFTLIPGDSDKESMYYVTNSRSGNDGYLLLTLFENKITMIQWILNEDITYTSLTDLLLNICDLYKERFGNADYYGWTDGAELVKYYGEEVAIRYGAILSIIWNEPIRNVRVVILLQSNLFDSDKLSISISFIDIALYDKRKEHDVSDF